MSKHIRDIVNNTSINSLLNKTWTGPLRDGYVEVGEDSICLVNGYKDYEEKIKKCEVKDDDVYLCGFQKSGTTLMAEMIWLLVNNLDYETARQKLIRYRVIQLEFASLFKCNDEKNREHFETLEILKKQQSPRCIKTHLHWSLLPEQITSGSKKPKTIFVFRNVEDLCVSYYHYGKDFEGFTGTFEDFCDLFLNGKICFAPYWKHFLSFYQRDQANVLFMKYEDVIDDLPGAITKVGNFLNKNLTDVEISKLSAHLSLNSMKSNPSVNYQQFKEELKISGDFIRVGKAGDHKNIMSMEMRKRFEKWTKDNLQDVNLEM